jgi:hypothetical protein
MSHKDKDSEAINHCCRSFASLIDVRKKKRRRRKKEKKEEDFVIHSNMKNRPIDVQE